MFMERFTVALLASGAVILIWGMGCWLANLRTRAAIHYLRRSIAESGVSSPLHHGEPMRALLTVPSASARTDGALCVPTSAPGEDGGAVHRREMPSRSTSLSARMAQAGCPSSSPAAGRLEPASPLRTAVGETFLPPSVDHTVHLYEADAEIVRSVADYFEPVITEGGGHRPRRPGRASAGDRTGAGQPGFRARRQLVPGA